MILITYLFCGIVFWSARAVLVCALRSLQRAQGSPPDEPTQGPVAHVFGLLLWPIELVAMVWVLTSAAAAGISAAWTAWKMRAR